ncbi:hypothetical protein BSFA1_55280 [Burkholderia sp. SFA1]|uniref:hypothetical protein n=1 Tax=Caballeronia sp. CLC5 TaxID=2906764 RepID=UPI001F1E7158|nr:hypothetical protein [Caballeronia sp. CLC5]MCE4573557.1 hypothetical protein [Caballeronia sp. CLC5]BBQ00400.1 hypothetical protein BSFA1_55280 [Burkholderia sp. SFA1]
MADKSKARYLISSETAQAKAELLQELAGGRNALSSNQALEAVARGCGFERLRELVATTAKLAAGEANSLNISASMLADDEHVDAETLLARRALQLETVRGVITCSYARAQELMMQWALSGKAHGFEPAPAEAVEAGYPEEKSERSIVDSGAELALEEVLNDALFAAMQEFGPDEPPHTPPATPSAPVAVSYKKRRLPVDER